MLEWINQQILFEDGHLHNSDHAHLIDAKIRVMWASSAFTKKGRSFFGQAEEVAYTTEEVEQFNAERGNRYNCYCSNIPVLLDDDGQIVNRELVEKLDLERVAWQKT